MSLTDISQKIYKLGLEKKRKEKYTVQWSAEAAKAADRMFMSATENGGKRNA